MLRPAKTAGERARMAAKFATGTQLRRSATEKDVAPMGLRCLVANLFEVHRPVVWTLALTLVLAVSACTQYRVAPGDGGDATGSGAGGAAVGGATGNGGAGHAGGG